LASYSSKSKLLTAEINPVDLRISAGPASGSSNTAIYAYALSIAIAIASCLLHPPDCYSAALPDLLNLLFYIYPNLVKSMTLTMDTKKFKKAKITKRTSLVPHYCAVH
jgi:hypothetical protein